MKGGPETLGPRPDELVDAMMDTDLKQLVDFKSIVRPPTIRSTQTKSIVGAVAAVSVGIYQGMPVLDLDYAEDSNCDTDMNVVMNDGGGFIEVQGTAEGHAFRRDEMDALLALAEKGIGELVAAQRAALAQG